MKLFASCLQVVGVIGLAAVLIVWRPLFGAGIVAASLATLGVALERRAS